MKHKIVFVDDEPMTVRALERLFANEPFEFFGFNSPRQALEQMKTIAPQVVLSDQRMPEMEGISFLGKVAERWPKTVRMILTGFCVPDNAYGAISRAGISRVLTKPWDDEQLLRQIRIAFQYSDSMQFDEVNQCEICGEEGPFGQVQMYRSYYMCSRCRNCYELLPGVVLESLVRFIKGNVL